MLGSRRTGGDPGFGLLSCPAYKSKRRPGPRWFVLQVMGAGCCSCASSVPETSVRCWTNGGSAAVAKSQAACCPCCRSGRCCVLLQQPRAGKQQFPCVAHGDGIPSFGTPLPKFSSAVLPEALPSAPRARLAPSAFLCFLSSRQM